MLVFISDLHFVDETAGKHNLPSSAFEKFLTSLKAHADKANAEEVKIIFLGDIFDLLRTEAWFQEKAVDRPWGRGTAKMRKRALSILSDIEVKNKDAFKLFKPLALKKRFGDIDIETVYIPGNHDRLCWLLDDLKKKIVNLLSLRKDNAENFRLHFSSIRYGVHALHGHAFDRFNYEGGPHKSDEDYRLMPIGDPITTELIAKLPYKLMINVEKHGNLSKQDKQRLKRNFQEIENVRPFSATLKWLLYQVEANRRIKNVIEDTVDEVVKEFEKLAFVKKWYDRHDKWFHPFDTADSIQAVLYFLKNFRVFSMGKLLELANRISGSFDRDDLAEEAAKLFSTLDSRIRYIVMGHTHDPVKKAQAFSKSGDRLFEHVYLNTGTRRKRYHECEDKSGFIGWKDMNYVMFYTPEEKPNLHGLPVFETWSGSLKREE